METVKFFERLGFDMYYTGKTQKSEMKSGSKPKPKQAKPGMEKNEEFVPPKLPSVKQSVTSEDTRVPSQSVIIAEAASRSNKEGLKIGLYLQVDELKNQGCFD